MTKITFEEACNKTAEWMEKVLHIDPCTVSWVKFDKLMSDFCKQYGFVIN